MPLLVCVHRLMQLLSYRDRLCDFSLSRSRTFNVPNARLLLCVLSQAIPGEVGAEQTKHYEAELEINDFPQHSRWKVRLCFRVFD